MRKLLLLFVAVITVPGFSAPCRAGVISRGAEFFYYDDRPGNAGRSDFFSGGATDWGVDGRIAYLRHYADFLKKYNGGLKLDEYATPLAEVEKIAAGLKPQPLPAVRRVTDIAQWRWALGDGGEEAGWGAGGFDDSAWERTTALPLVIHGEETRGLWARAAVTTGQFDKTFIEFDAVLGASEIWVNGKKVQGPDALHFDSAPFRVDLTSYLSRNAANIITIHVQDHKERGESGSRNEPSKLMGWGLLGPVRLIETGGVFIDNVFARTESLSAGSARLRVQFTLKNYKTSEFKGSAEVRVRKWFPSEAASPDASAVFPVSVMAGSGEASPMYYALDFGPEDSPLEPGFERVSPVTKYSDATGFGWPKKPDVEAFDGDAIPLVEFIEPSLKRDGVEGSGEAQFKLKTEMGMWAFRFVTGSASHTASVNVSYTDGSVVKFDEAKPLKPFEITSVNATEFVRGGSAVLKFTPAAEGGVFTINGLVAENHVPFTQRFEKSLDLPRPETWSPETPRLYELRLTIKDDMGKALDDAMVTFGVVLLEEKDGDIFVNGRRYRLRGVLETHSFPPERTDDLRCIAPPDRWIVQDIADNKAANSNVMRFHPAEGMGTNYQRWLEYADQMGMFVFWSPRVWFHWGTRGRAGWLAPLDAHLEPSVLLARNHPSIFAWEGGNETYNNNDIWDQRAADFSDEYYHRMEALDPSRFILPISFWYAQFEGKPDFYRIDPNRGKELTWPGSGKSPLAFWSPKTFWDIHPYPGWYGSWAEIWWNAGRGDFYKKDKSFMVSEFGAEGMPNWELYKDESYYHVWDDTSKPAFHEKNRLGRNLDFSEWEISQAYQALVMYHNIAVYRTEDADGLSICTGAEGRHNGKYFKGLRDMYRRPKLAYYATREAYRPLFVEALNGDIVLSPNDTLEPVLVNDGPARTVSLDIIFRGEDGAEAARKTIKGIALPETGNLRLPPFPAPKLENGKYYYTEYIVSGGN